MSRISMSRRVAHIAILAVLFVFAGCFLAADDAHAQASADKNLAQKGTMELGSKEWDKDQLPGTLEISLGVGSTFVMIAVMKWL